MKLASATRNDTLELWIRDDDLGFAVSPDLEFVRSLVEIRRGLGDGHVTAARLEGAIAGVEDLIMPVLREIPSARRLMARNASFTGVLSLVMDGKPNASIESVERLFNDLADHAAGSPVAWRHPESPDALALELLVLREVMHHGGFDVIYQASGGE